MGPLPLQHVPAPGHHVLDLIPHMLARLRAEDIIQLLEGDVVKTLCFINVADSDSRLWYEEENEDEGNDIEAGENCEKL